MAIFKSLIPSREWAEGPVRAQKESTCSGFVVCVIADR